MSAKTLFRSYKLSDAELASFADALVTVMTRDTAEFASRGVDAADITALGDKEDEFELFPTDYEYQGLVKITTDEKDAVRLQLEIDIRNVSDRALLKWGQDSGQYKRFEVKNLKRMSDKDIHFAARRVFRIGTEYLLSLADEGLTQAILDTLEATTESYELKLNAIRDAMTVRDTKTEERIALGNELYALVAKYCEIGKVIWKEVSEAKYNDYVIYPTVHSGLSKPQNLAAEYDTLTPPNITLSWDAVSGATSYDVYYDDVSIGSPAGDFNLLNNYAASPVEIPAVIDRRFYFKIKAKNGSATSSYSDEVFVDVPVA